MTIIFLLEKYYYIKSITVVELEDGTSQKSPNFKNI